MGVYTEYAKALSEFIPQERIYTDYLSRFAYGTDASCYRYIPEIVVKTYSEEELQNILHLSSKMNIPLTFRASGTSLSGQACGNSVLVVISQGWDSIEINRDASLISLEPGVLGIEANTHLQQFAKKIGPDPATIAIASIGGIVANNSSGMCCGVEQNTYKTIDSIRVLLADGTCVDTGSMESVERWHTTHKQFIDTLLAIRSEIMQDTELVARIKRKYSIKNTTGYSLNAFVEYEKAEDILTHIMVGSEGTLGCITNVVYRTVENKPCKASALVFYTNVHNAVEAITHLVTLGSTVSAAELMDDRSLHTVAGVEGMPSEIQNTPDGTACLLLQTEAYSKEELEKNITAIKEVLGRVPTYSPVVFSDDSTTQEQWWKIRKGLFPIASSVRRPGSTVIIEDICFHIEDLADGILLLQKLFKQYGFDSGCIFGHALSGNVHFVITPILDDEKELHNFEALLQDMSEYVAKAEGSIKAEHGTGRMVAPFVELEWGEKAYSLMKKVKTLFDPHNILNPDVLLSNNPKIHMEHLKQMPESHYELVNTCMECGFCEKVCPSRGITLTPRQRITIQREIARLEREEPTSPYIQELKNSYAYSGDETCATCSMCKTVCPLMIDTKYIAQELRHHTKDSILVRTIRKNFSFFTSLGRGGIAIVSGIRSLFGIAILIKMTRGIRKIGLRFVPQIRKNFPRMNSMALRSDVKKYPHSVIYFSACLNRMFAPAQKMADPRPLQEVFTSLCHKANIGIIYPKKIHGMCCAKPFEGYPKEKDAMLNMVYEQLCSISNNGEIPIVIDHTSCANYVIDAFANSTLTILDMHQFLLEHIVPAVTIEKINDTIGLFTMCSGKHKKYDVTMKELALACTTGDIIVPNIPCCGFAGDKGFFTPELNISATSQLRAIFSNTTISRGYSTSSTCEIGFADATGFSWQHIAYLLDSVSRNRL